MIFTIEHDSAARFFEISVDVAEAEHPSEATMRDPQGCAISWVFDGATMWEGDEDDGRDLMETELLELLPGYRQIVEKELPFLLNDHFFLAW